MDSFHRTGATLFFSYSQTSNIWNIFRFVRGKLNRKLDQDSTLSRCKKKIKSQLLNKSMPNNGLCCCCQPVCPRCDDSQDTCLISMQHLQWKGSPPKKEIVECSVISPTTSVCLTAASIIVNKSYITAGPEVSLYLNCERLTQVSEIIVGRKRRV